MIKWPRPAYAPTRTYSLCETQITVSPEPSRKSNRLLVQPAKRERLMTSGLIISIDFLEEKSNISHVPFCSRFERGRPAFGFMLHV